MLQIEYPHDGEKPELETFNHTSYCLYKREIDPVILLCYTDFTPTADDEENNEDPTYNHDEIIQKSNIELAGGTPIFGEVRSEEAEESLQQVINDKNDVFENLTISSSSKYQLAESFLILNFTMLSSLLVTIYFGSFSTVA
jgi:hypothetical protein